MTEPPDTAALLAEIERFGRQRRVGFWLAAGGAVGLAWVATQSMSMMHASDDYETVDATIVAVERDPQGGELWMTSEFVDATGKRHRERETEGYHYAPGEPKVGQSIEYLVRTSPLTGDVDAFPRADRILQWFFGGTAAFLAALALGLLVFVARQRTRRRHLVRHGRRERVQAARIGHRVVPFTGTRGAGPARLWRLEGRWFDPDRSGFVDVRSDWQNTPAPELHDDTPLPDLLVDPRDPRRTWLPVGTLVRQER